MTAAAYAMTPPAVASRLRVDAWPGTTTMPFAGTRGSFGPCATNKANGHGVGVEGLQAISTTRRLKDPPT